MSNVHDVIEANKDEIIRLWMHGIGESPFAEGLSPSELSGVMPEYLASLGNGVTGDPAQLAEVQTELIERHLSSRLDHAEEMVAGLVDAHRIRAGHRLPIHPAWRKTLDAYYQRVEAA